MNLCQGSKNVFDPRQKHFLVSQQQSLFPQHVFPMQLNLETFGSATIFSQQCFLVQSGLNFSENVEQTLPVLRVTNPNVYSSERAAQYHNFPNPDGCKNRPITPCDGSIQTQGQQDRKDEQSEEEKEFTETKQRSCTRVIFRSYNLSTLEKIFFSRLAFL